jgi:hypothetical protein
MPQLSTLSHRATFAVILKKHLTLNSGGAILEPGNFT